jgi:hypothetical protein
MSCYIHVDLVIVEPPEHLYGGDRLKVPQSATPVVFIRKPGMLPDLPVSSGHRMLYLQSPLELLRPSPL